MTLQIGLLLAIILAAVVLFSFEWVSADVTALGVLLVLVMTGLLPAERAFAGFGSETVLMLLGLMILTAALARTGVVELAGRAILRRVGNHPERLPGMITVATAALSAVISNTAAAAFFLPIVIGVSRRLQVNVSRLLMPLAFAAILTSSVTLISTSSNMVVSGLMTQHGLPPMRMFELAPVGLPISIIGLLYILTIGQRMIPNHQTATDLADEFGLRPYLTEVVILDTSSLIGKTLAESGLGHDLDLTVLRVRRGKQAYLAPQADLHLEAGDVLLVEGQRDEILKVKSAAGIDLEAEVKFGLPDLETKETVLVEAILMPRSPLIGRSLKGVRFRERYGLQVLAIHSREQTLHQKISQTPLRLGDTLLIQGPRANVAALQNDQSFQILGTVESKLPNLRRARLAMAIFGFTIGVAALEIIPLPVAVLTGALLAFLTGCITPEEAYRQVEWKVLILIGSMLALGNTMQTTGAADFLARQIVALVGQAHPAWLLAGFFLLTVILTQPMSNQAAAAVVIPVALQTAGQLGLNPRTFAVAIAVAASTSYLTPLEPACLLVYGPGRYRFVDFVKVGSLLTVIIFILAMLLTPLIWPL